MSEDLTKRESLSYRPAKSPPAISGFNSVVIRPEMKVNKAEVAGQVFEQPNQSKIIILEIEGLISQVNVKIEKLHEPTYDKKTYNLITQALEEIDIFQKTTLYELRKELE